MKFWKENGSLCWKHQYETVQITPWGKNALRVRTTKYPAFTSHNWALEEPIPDTDANVCSCLRHHDLLPRRSEIPERISQGL